MRFIYTKAFAWFAGCLVVITGLVFLQVKGWLFPLKAAFVEAPRPVMYVAGKIVSPVRDFFSTLYGFKRIINQNAQLQNQVILLQQNLVDYNNLKTENDALRKELGFLKNTKQNLVPCTVLSQNAFGSTDTVMLNCGLADGVAEGEAVIEQGYLVGKVIYASRDSSAVLLAVGSQFSTDAKVSQSGADGIVKGSFGSGMLLDQLSQNATVQSGWLVASGGINDKIPKNILIGEIGEVISGPNDLFKKTTLISPVDFNNLEFVFVVKP